MVIIMLRTAEYAQRVYNAPDSTAIEMQNAKKIVQDFTNVDEHKSTDGTEESVYAIIKSKN